MKIKQMEDFRGTCKVCETAFPVRKFQVEHDDGATFLYLVDVPLTILCPEYDSGTLIPPHTILQAALNGGCASPSSDFVSNAHLVLNAESRSVIMLDYRVLELFITNGMALVTHRSGSIQFFSHPDYEVVHFCFEVPERSVKVSA